MMTEFDDDIEDHLDPQNTGLEIAATFVADEQLSKKTYLNMPFTNIYDLDQANKELRRFSAGTHLDEISMVIAPPPLLL